MKKVYRPLYALLLLAGMHHSALANNTNTTQKSINHQKHTTMAEKKKKQIRVLSIDGGGVRGIIPARILQEIEERTGRRIHEIFDLVIGNSTGGILALGLVTPDTQGQPRFTAKDLVAFYQDNCAKIFSHPFGRKLTTGWGLWGPRYSRTNLDQILQEVLGDIRVSQVLTPAMVISYSLDRSMPHLWTSRKAKKNPHENHYIRDLAGATSAAPTYFPPKVITAPDGSTLHEIDGGVWANNPEFTAVEELKAMGVSTQDVLMVAIGTGHVKLNQKAIKLRDAGVIGWLTSANLIDIMMSAESEWSKSAAEAIYPHNYRLQVAIAPEISAMDNSSKENMDALLKAAETYLQEQHEVVEELCEVLKSPAQTGE